MFLYRKKIVYLSRIDPGHEWVNGWGCQLWKRREVKTWNFLSHFLSHNTLPTPKSKGLDSDRSIWRDFFGRKPANIAFLSSLDAWFNRKGHNWVIYFYGFLFFFHRITPSNYVECWQIFPPWFDVLILEPLSLACLLFVYPRRHHSLLSSHIREREREWEARNLMVTFRGEPQ